MQHIPSSPGISEPILSHTLGRRARRILRRGLRVLVGLPGAFAVLVACGLALGPVEPLAAMAGQGGQTPATYTLPRDLEQLPGNASLSLPLRWTEGVLQVIYRQDQIPPGIVGMQLTAITLRRPAWFDEAAYPARTRTLRLHVEPANRQPQNLSKNLSLNRGATTAHGYGPAPVTIGATTTHGVGDSVGGPLCTIPVQPPFTIPSVGGIMVEIETLDGPLSIDGNDILWVDAIEAPNGGNDGLSFELGQTGCSANGPLRLLFPENQDMPAPGDTFSVELTGADPGASGFVLQTLDPFTMNEPWSVGFGMDLTPLQAPGCFQWSEGEFATAQSFTVGSDGSAGISITVPTTNVTPGVLASIQTVILEPGLNGVGYATSTGLALTLGGNWIQDGVASVLSPGTKAKSPWERFLGLAPVLELTVQ